jgi:hypothetical protein
MTITTIIVPGPVPVPGFPHLKCLDKRGDYTPDDAGFAACIRYLSDPSTPNCLVLVDHKCVRTWSIAGIPRVTKSDEANKSLWWLAQDTIACVTPDGFVGMLAYPNG